MRSLVRSLALSLLVAPVLAAAQAPELWRQVEIVRTAHGVPHIRAENLRAAGYALAWLQLEDYGPRTAMQILRASGRMGLVFGRDSMEQDFLAQHARTIAIASYPQLEPNTRDIYDGFALGLDRYIALHPGEYPATMPTDFTGYDVLAGDMGEPAYAMVRRFLSKLDPKQFPPETGRRGAPGEGDDELTRDNVGSNAWAFAPSRTKSGKAILLRNPHLVWTAGLLRSAHDGAGALRLLRRLPHRRPLRRRRRLQPQPRLVHDEQRAAAARSSTRSTSTPRKPTTT